MDHLQLRCEDLHALYVVDLTSEMITYYGETEGVPEYINILKDNKKKSQRSKIPTPNVTLVIIARKFILLAQAFTPEMKEWLNKRSVNKKWLLRNSTFLESQ